MKGHSGKRGNKRADGEAKVAAKGQSSCVHNLPDFLSDGQMPISISMWQQKYDFYLKSKWRAVWAVSLRHERIHRINLQGLLQAYQRAKLHSDQYTDSIQIWACPTEQIPTQDK